MQYNCAKWEHLREKIMRRDKYKCQECLRYGKQVQAKHVHHVNPAEFYEDLKYNPHNLISLCSACHNEMHDRDSHKLTVKGEQLRQRINRKYNLCP